jgi:hypothetical protein
MTQGHIPDYVDFQQYPCENLSFAGLLDIWVILADRSSDLRKRERSLGPVLMNRSGEQGILKKACFRVIVRTRTTGTW